MQIGDTIWCHDFRSQTRPWFEHEITGETRQSWIVGPYKVNKKTMSENLGSYGSRKWHTRDSMNESRWVRANRYKIAEKVQLCQDAKVLYQVAQVLGFDVTDPSAPTA